MQQCYIALSHVAHPPLPILGLYVYSVPKFDGDPIFFKKETQKGPIFPKKGDLKGTFFKQKGDLTRSLALLLPEYRGGIVRERFATQIYDSNSAFRDTF